MVFGVYQEYKYYDYEKDCFIILFYPIIVTGKWETPSLPPESSETQ